jgi:hypothetical protein
MAAAEHEGGEDAGESAAWLGGGVKPERVGREEDVKEEEGDVG